MRGIEQKIVIAPIAQAKKPLWDPGRKGQHQPDLKTEDDIENNAELRRHNLRGDGTGQNPNRQEPETVKEP